MRAYAAIIIDSFRQAVVSRVLLVMLILITLFLGSLAPLGITREVTWRVSPGDIEDLPVLIVNLLSSADSEEITPASQLWDRLDEEMQQRLTTLVPEQMPPPAIFDLRNDLAEAITEAIDDPKFYSPLAWKDVSIDDEAKELLDEGVENLTNQQRNRLHRLLLEAGLPGAIRRSPTTSVTVNYFGYEPLPAAAMRPEDLKLGIQLAIQFILGFGVVAAATMVAILFTCWIVPDMFQPGSIELLLSKPINRSLLLITKFLGGCSFTAVAAAYLMFGLWLIVGVRFDVWIHALLLFIPIFVFLFAIYYSVSTLAGVLWKNSIICVVVTVLFWLSCFSLGSVKGLCENLIIIPQRFSRIEKIKGEFFSVTDNGAVQRFDEAENQWVDILVSPNDPPGFARPDPSVLGPVYDAKHDLLITAPGRSFLGQSQPLRVAQQEDDYAQRMDGALTPLGAWALLQEPSGGVLILGTHGIFRLTGDPRSEAENVRLFGIELPLTGAQNIFSDVSPEEDVLFLSPMTAAIDAVDGRLAVFSREQLWLFEPTEQGQFVQQFRTKVGTKDRPVLLSLAGDHIVVVQEDSTVQVLSSKTGKLETEAVIEDAETPRFLHAAPGGRWFAVVHQGGTMTMLDLETDGLQVDWLSNLDDVSAVTFPSKGRLLVADEWKNVTEYALSSQKKMGRTTPTLSWVERAYRYGILPMYTIYPKPAALDETRLYLMNGDKTLGLPSDDLSQAQVQLNPWQPVWSSAIFMAVVLGIACWYVSRADL